MFTPTVTRTHTEHPHFELLIKELDYELWHELKEDQATYDQHNKVPGIPTAVIVYVHDEPVACGCFKAYEPGTMEVKRMYVKKAFRGKGLSRIVLLELENWAKQQSFTKAILETSIQFTVARKLYEESGYNIIPNYSIYEGLTESVCMGKALI